MARLDTETDEQFLTRIKKEFKEDGVDLILIDDGDIFIGSWNQLYDCFMINPYQLERWCDLLRYDCKVIKGRK